MKWDPLSRRHLLQGLGASLALPLLPSLLPKSARAQVSAVQKTFIGVQAQNGLFRMYGPDSELMPASALDYATYSTQGFTPTDVPGTHRVHTASLQTLATKNGGKISDLIDASFTPMLGKMMMIQGIDYLSLVSFHHRAQFGNYYAVSGTSGQPAMATIENVLAHSNTFYKNPLLKGTTVCFTDNPAEQSNQYYGSQTYDNPMDRVNSAIVGAQPVYSNPGTLWDAFFATNTASVPLRKTVVDRVLSDYNALRGSSRLGAQDKQKLDVHVQFLQETQQKVAAVSQICNVPRPAAVTGNLLTIQTINSVITALVACGKCNSFMGMATTLQSTGGEDWHNWSHAGYHNDDMTGFVDAIVDPNQYGLLKEQNRKLIKGVCLDLATKLDAQGLLDNTVLVWLMEHNKRGHEAWNVPAITFGSAGGVFKTGQYLDYRNMQQRDDKQFSRFGYPHNQLLANILTSMGMDKSEYEPLNKASSSVFKANSGYGVSYYNTAASSQISGNYNSWTGHDLSDWLPNIKA
jgi:hypothetical protein